MDSSTTTKDTAKAFAVLSVAAALSMVAVAISRHDKSAFASHPSHRDLFPWNVVQPEQPWFPALAHPDTPEIVTAVLSDWLGRVDMELADEQCVYKDRPDLSQVRLLRFQLPPGIVPSVEGVTFSIEDQTSDNRDDALMGDAPGDFGFRFDAFRFAAHPLDRFGGVGRSTTHDGESVEIVMCLLQYADSPRWIRGGQSITYYVRKQDGRWVAELWTIVTKRRTIIASGHLAT